ncbi:unnamed protein product [Spirodela intermedia]|uniref:Uncharacterized protein n=1 Tax=Spirodela intermedia TaxID=51605 RepID=A0A7I8IVS1_SPIIN|nr:unnamed protein product [Spirodela intermedia]CAA6661880.1 unnamed protein product [Spirodela intermedia]
MVNDYFYDVSEGAGLGNDGGVGKDVHAELATFLGGVDLVLARRRQQFEVLHQAANVPPAGAEGEKAEVVAVGLHLGLLLQEPLRPEFLRLLPVVGVIGEEPGVDQDLALGGDVVAGELGVMEVHVGNEEGDGHAKAESLLDDGLQVGELRHVRFRHLDTGTEHGIDLAAQLLLDLWVVHQLRYAPLDRPEGRLDR